LRRLYCIGVQNDAVPAGGDVKEGATGAWRLLLAVLIVWVAGNAVMAIGLRHHADAMRRFEATASAGSTFTNPVALVAGCAFLLVIGIVTVGLAWQMTFGFRGPRPFQNALAVVLLVFGLALDGFLLLDTSFVDVGHVDRSASVAGWAAIVGVLLLVLASVQRRQRPAQLGLRANE
jgi:hypothetical protein